MAMAGMAGTAVGVAIAVIREKADRRSIEKEAQAEVEAQAEDKKRPLEPADLDEDLPGDEASKERN